MSAVDQRLEDAILKLLEPGALSTITPEDAARAVGKGWRLLTERARDAARRLCASRRIDFVQGGRVVDASSAKGPVLLRLRRLPGG